MIHLLSKTGLGRSGHVRFLTFGRISHASGPKPILGRNFWMILHGCAWRNSKNMFLRPKNLKHDQTTQTIQKEYVKIAFISAFKGPCTLP